MLEIKEPTVLTHSNVPGWEYVSRVPTFALRSSIRLYSGYYQNTEQPVCRLQAPSGHVMLVLGFGSDMKIRQIGSGVDSGINSGVNQSFVAGLEAQPLLREHDGERYCIAIALPPWVAYRLFQGAATEFVQEVVALEDIWDDADRLVEQLSEQSSWTQRFALVDRLLKEKLFASQHLVRPEIRWAWNQLEAQGGCILIRQLARTIGWSNRYFARQFQEQTGVTPKAAARQMRFAQAYRLLRTSNNHTLSEIALDCGYSDQSHFTREFHAFCGCAPNTFQKAKAAVADFPGLPGEPGVPGEMVRDIDE
ncbi:helix-turn-helix domain-containing protein [Egbenema bharatensis]|uniref:helix-turn-helix domain-containing protein n=1 Tax=Egbenema bharatensis TaxID=3463334 RepID=UPI003A84C23B